jgi:glc operon protein GlcG
MSLTYDEAQRAIAAAHARAKEIGIRIAMAVLDEGARLIALGRMDGAPPLSPRIAEAKASGSALTLREGEALAEMYKERPGFFAVVERLAHGNVVPGAGSRLLRREGRVIGALGVSGGLPQQDVDCAEAALRALGL